MTATSVLMTKAVESHCFSKLVSSWRPLLYQYTHSLALNSLDSFLLYFHMASPGHSPDIFSRGLSGKDSAIRSQTAPPDNFRRKSWVQGISESDIILHHLAECASRQHASLTMFYHPWALRYKQEEFRVFSHFPPHTKSFSSSSLCSILVPFFLCSPHALSINFARIRFEWELSGVCLWLMRPVCAGELRKYINHRGDHRSEIGFVLCH